MADLPDISGVLGSFANLATSNSAAVWISVGVNIILSTIVGGIVLLVVMEMLSKAWGESVSVGKCFIFVLIINVITQFGMSFILPFVSFLPYSYLIVSLLLWIGLMKAFFGELSIAHAAIAGIIGFVLSMFLVPILTGIVLGFLPIAALGA